MGEGYVLHEVAAPEGFELAEDITFAVEETSEIQFEGMVDEPRRTRGTKRAGISPGAGQTHSPGAPNRRQRWAPC